MRKFLTLCLILIINLAMPLPGHAQTSQTQDSINEVQAIAAWTENYFALVNDMVSLFTNEAINIALATHENDDLGPMREAALKYGRDRQETLLRLENSVDTLPPLPELKTLRKLQRRRTEKIINTMEAQIQQLPVMLTEITVASGHMETLLGRISKGDFSGVTEIAKQQNLAIIRFIEAENLQVESALIALEKDNPNYAFQSIVLAQNNISIEEIKMVNINLETDMTTLERQPYTQRIKSELETISKYLGQGRKAKLKMAAQMQAAVPQMKTDQEKQFIKNVIMAVETFSKNFDVEQKMYDLALNSYELYTSDGVSSNISDNIDANDEQILALVAERMTHVNRRVALIKK